MAAACMQNMLELMFSPSFFLIGICEDTLVPEGEPKRLPEEIHACETTCSNDVYRHQRLHMKCVCVCASTSSCFCLFFPSFFVAFSLWWMFACVRLCVCEGHFFFPVLVACLSTISQMTFCSLSAVLVSHLLGGIVGLSCFSLL